MTLSEEMEEMGMTISMMGAELLATKKELKGALAALEETQQQLWIAKEERDSQQRVCIKIMEELAEAQQTIALKQSNIEMLVGQVTDETALHAKTAAKLIIAEQTIARQQEEGETQP